MDMKTRQINFGVHVLEVVALLMLSIAAGQPDPLVQPIQYSQNSDHSCNPFFPECNPLVNRVRQPHPLSSGPVWSRKPRSTKLIAQDNENPSQVSMLECGHNEDNCASIRRYSLIIGNFGMGEHLAVLSENWKCLLGNAVTASQRQAWADNFSGPSAPTNFVEILGNPDLEGTVCETSGNSYLMVDSSEESCNEVVNLMNFYVKPNSIKRKNMNAQLLISHTDEDHVGCAFNDKSPLYKILHGTGNGGPGPQRLITSVYENNNHEVNLKMMSGLEYAAFDDIFEVFYPKYVGKVFDPPGPHALVCEAGKLLGETFRNDRFPIGEPDACLLKYKKYYTPPQEKPISELPIRRSIVSDGTFFNTMTSTTSTTKADRVGFLARGGRDNLNDNIKSLWAEGQYTKISAVFPTLDQFYCCLLPRIGTPVAAYTRMRADRFKPRNGRPGGVPIDAMLTNFWIESHYTHLDPDEVVINRASVQALVQLDDGGGLSSNGLLTGDGFCKDGINSVKAMGVDLSKFFFYKVPHHFTTTENYNNQECYTNMKASFYVIAGGKDRDFNPDIGALKSLLTSNGRGVIAETTSAGSSANKRVKLAVSDPCEKIDCWSPWCRQYNLAVVCPGAASNRPPHFKLRAESYAKVVNGRLTVVNDDLNKKNFEMSAGDEAFLKVVATGPFDAKSSATVSRFGPAAAANICG